MRYHQERSHFLHSSHLWIQFFVFALATASMAHFIESWLSDSSVDFLWAIVSLLTLFSLVFNPAGKHVIHKSLYQGFTVLHGKIMANPGADDKMLAEWAKDIHALYAEEPPLYRALVAHCDNQVSLSANDDKGDFAVLKWYELMLRNIFRFQSSEFPTYNQKRQKSASC